MTVGDRKYEKGLRELTLSVIHDLEPHDPPEGMKERLLEKIEKCEAAESIDKREVLIAKKFFKPWLISAAVVCALISTCYAYTALRTPKDPVANKSINQVETETSQNTTPPQETNNPPDIKGGSNDGKDINKDRDKGQTGRLNHGDKLPGLEKSPAIEKRKDLSRDAKKPLGNNGNNTKKNSDKNKKDFKPQNPINPKKHPQRKSQHKDDGNIRWNKGGYFVDVEITGKRIEVALFNGTISLKETRTYTWTKPKKYKKLYWGRG